jgi:hypothetical protein
MSSAHKKVLTILFLLTIFLCYIFNCTDNKQVYANNTNSYLVLIQQKDGSWKEYTNLIETSDSEYLMVKAKKISKALGLDYKNNGDGTFVIGKSSTNYNSYTRNSKEFTYTNGALRILKMAPDKAYSSKLSYCYLCQVNTLNTLVYYKCFSNVKAEEYSGYDGIICFSKYKDIPESVSIIEKKPAKAPTPTPKPEAPFVNVEGVEFPLRDNFLANEKALSDWGGTALLWSELEKEVDSKIIESTNLIIDSNKIEFTHLAAGSDGVSLTKADNGYQIAVSVRITGSVIADLNASILRAMIATISSKPSLVYEAIFESFTTSETHGINEDTYVTIGDCKIKVKVKDGIVTYYMKA